MPSLRFNSHVLFLSNSPAVVRARLSGAVAGLTDAAPLRDDISTDEICPLPAMVHYDATLGRYPYTGFEAGDETPIGRDAIRAAGVEVVVAGRRYGKGSSREHSVVAERSAGIRLVIAESFERIYRQNADNVGLLTATDFGLVSRIQNGEAIDLDELLAGRDALAATIVRLGGLLAYGRARLQDVRPTSETNARVPPPDPPLTLFEKIVARHAIETPDTPLRLARGQGGFVRADFRFIHEYYTGMCAHLLDDALGTDLTLFEPGSILTFEDHLSYVHRSPVHVKGNLVGNVAGLSRAHRAFARRFHLVEHGYLQPQLSAGDAGNTGSEGISHAMMAERYALPGQLVVGTDSHTPHSGAVGCVAFGIGTTDMANAFVTGAVRMVMPDVLRVEFNGRLPAGVSREGPRAAPARRPCDSIGAGVGKVFEFGGSVVGALSTDERATLTNMTAELGGFTGIVEPDGETVRFLKERRGVEFKLEPWMRSDPGARYAEVLRIDASVLSPMVARPGDPGNGVPLRDADGARQGRHRLRRIVHRRKAGGFRSLSRSPGVGRGARAPGRAGRRALSAIRDRRGAGLLHPARLSRGVRGGRRRDPPARVRGVRQLRSGLLDFKGAGHRKRDQPEFPRALRTRAGLARESADRCRKCHCRQARVIRGVAARLIQDRSIRRADACYNDSCRVRHRLPGAGNESIAASSRGVSCASARGLRPPRLERIRCIPSC